jgi:hypothetical protein
MNTLVVIHAENGYVDEEFELVFGRENAKQNKELFTDIANEMKGRIRKGEDVFFIPDDSESPDSEHMFPAIRDLSSEIDFFKDQNTYEEKMLSLKEKLINNNISQVDIAGVSYSNCVGDFFKLCYGNNSEPNITKENLEYFSKRLGWSKEKFEKIYRTIIPAVIIDDLTDKNHIDY